MWGNGPDRRDDAQTGERETQRLSRDEYDRPRYGSAPEDFGDRPREHSSNRPEARQEHSAGGYGRGDWDTRANQDISRSGHVERTPHELHHQAIDNMPAHAIMTRRVATVHPATSVERAARLMGECDCGALPVVNDNGVLVGMLTDRDITLRIVARGRDPRHAIVGDCMTERVFACYATESIADCMRQMARHQVRRIPIVDDQGRLLGLLSQSDLARHAGVHRIPEERRALVDMVSAVSQPAYRYYR